MIMLNGGYAEQAHEILPHMATHRDLKNGMVHDTSLCHGSAGIAHAFNRAHRRTGDHLFSTGADKWLQHTIDIYESPAGLGFYGQTGSEAHSHVNKVCRRPAFNSIKKPLTR